MSGTYSDTPLLPPEVTRARHGRSQKIVDDLIGTMEVSALMYSIRTEGLTVNQVNEVPRECLDGRWKESNCFDKHRRR